MAPADITIAIVAYNAEDTIERAVKSAIKSGPYPILLVDDHSSDQTTGVAQQAGGQQITIIKSHGKHCVGAARQTAIETITTPFGLWLDADDEILPDRPRAFLTSLKENKADLVYGEGFLVNETSGDQSLLSIPGFVNEPKKMVRNLERNWLPLLHCGFKTSFAKQVGFDTTFECAEDYDFFIRALFHNGNIHGVKGHHYLYYHRAGTISRNLAKTRQHIGKTLNKLTAQDKANLFKTTNMSDAEQAFILGSSAVYQGQHKEAVSYLSPIIDSTDTLPQYARTVGWSSRFLLASCHWALGNHNTSHDLLKSLLDTAASPDVLNNLACDAIKRGHLDEARNFLEQALALYPPYSDANNNLKLISSPTPSYTSHPLRIEKSRDTYE